jgi:hypothetical protein
MLLVPGAHVSMTPYAVGKAPLDQRWSHARRALSLKRYVVAKRSSEVIANQTVFAVNSLAPAPQLARRMRIRCWRHFGIG